MLGQVEPHDLLFGRDAQAHELVDDNTDDRGCAGAVNDRDRRGKELGFQLKTMGALNTIVYQLLRNLAWQDREDSLLAAEDANIRRLKRVLNHIQQNFTSKVSLKELAARENLDMFYLSHFVKDHLGISFQSYVSKLRLEKAVFLIANTTKKMIDICLECGFSDYRYLYRLFLAEYGCTPQQYRADYRTPRPLSASQSEEGLQRILSQLQESAELFPGFQNVEGF